MLRNTLRELVDEAGFAALGIAPTARAEELSVADYVRLANCADVMKNGPPQRACRFGPWLSRLLLHRAGVHAEQRVDRAEADQAGGQRHDADPGPDRTAQQRPGDQRQADDDAQDAVDTANVAVS